MFLPLVIRLDELKCSHLLNTIISDIKAAFEYSEEFLIVTYRGDAELLLPHLLQLQDLLQSLRDLRPDANIFTLPRLNTHDESNKSRSVKRFITQADYALVKGLAPLWRPLREGAGLSAVDWQTGAS